MNSKVTINDIESSDQPLTCLTCYDYLTARVMDRVSELDMILVGDSLGNVMLGYDDTIPVITDDMVHHTKAVSKGVEDAFLVADIPFMELARDRDHVVRIVQRLCQQGGAEAVKIEGGRKNMRSIQHIVNHDVPVIGHLGLTPQSVQALGGYRVQANSKPDIKQLGRDARALEETGVSAIVLECIPEGVAGELTELLDVPTIGIGAGSGCDGQVLVWQDMMGLTGDESPKFVRQWGDFDQDLARGVKSFCEAVKNKEYPSEEESFQVDDDISELNIKELLTSGINSGLENE
ncbi:MAG: 3-methyl-2-oxobutanoate hydroxymethyltransferase [bacterium]